MNSHPDLGPRSDAQCFPGPARSRWHWLLYLSLAIALFGAARYFEVQDRLRQALDWVGQLGPWGVVFFIAFYVAAAILFIPGSVLTLGAGAVYGVAWGSICASIGSTLGATGAFLVSRYVARDALVRKFEGNNRFAAIDRAVAEEGWWIVVLTRLSPVFPFALLNYGFGLTRVKLSHYVVASWIGMMPATVMYAYLGSLAKAATGTRVRTSGQWALYGLGLLATVVVTLFVTRIANRALDRKIVNP